MLSIVIPCYNEEEVLLSLPERIKAVGDTWGDDFEVVFVDDGSVDGTWPALNHICETYPGWKAIRFSRNFGHQAAVSAGLKHTSGDAVMVMDADLQDPPEVLTRFVQKWCEGYDVVYGVRRKRKESAPKRLAYHLFYRLLARIAHPPIPLDSGDFCLMDRKIVDILNALGEQNPFIRGLRAWIGFRQIGIEYERDARAAGTTHYSLSRLLRLAGDGLLSFSQAPLRLSVYLGLLVSATAMVGAVLTFLQRIFADQLRGTGLEPVPGFATTVISILFLGGVQLVCIGILGEYVGRIYEEVKRRPRWIERSRIGCDAHSAKTHSLRASHRAYASVCGGEDATVVHTDDE